MPPSIEERVAFVEGKVEEHSRGFGEAREMLVHVDGHVRALDQKVDRFRGELAVRIDALDQKVDRFRDELSARIDAVHNGLSSRLDALDQKVDQFREELSARIDAVHNGLSSRLDALDQKLDQKMTSQFRWIVSIQVTVLVAIVVAFSRG